jgi:hypothetical protein
MIRSTIPTTHTRRITTMDDAVQTIMKLTEYYVIATLKDATDATDRTGEKVAATFSALETAVRELAEKAYPVRDYAPDIITGDDERREAAGSFAAGGYSE